MLTLLTICILIVVCIPNKNKNRCLFFFFNTKASQDDQVTCFSILIHEKNISSVSDIQSGCKTVERDETGISVEFRLPI